MVKIVRLGLGFVLVLFLFSFKFVNAQGSASYTSSQALDFFNKGDYALAEQAYSYLYKKYPKDAKYNFYLGICKIKNRKDISGAVKLLNYARIKGMGNNTYFYLGRANQLSYHFDEALNNFNRFLKYASKTDKKIEIVNQYMEECRNGKNISLKIYNIEVVSKEVVSKDNLLEKYHPVKDVGHLYKNKQFFESGVNPNNILFETERGDVVYFSMATSEEDTLSVYKMEKLLDGWSESKKLGAPVNSVYNDAYPFLETDGVTFYFASDRPGGFGGYDIYKVFYDSETQSFLDPVNLGVPFNSPDDDFLFVSDEFNKVAWFASNRETRGDDFMVYTIVWDGNQVRNMAESENQITEMAKLKVSGEEEAVSEVAENVEDEDMSVSGSVMEKEKSFKFNVNDTIIYTEFDQFLNDRAKGYFKEGYALEQQKDSLAAVLHSKRNKYGTMTNSVEQNKVVNDILTLESQVYSLEDLINEKYMHARQYELNEVLNQIKSGSYKPVSSTTSSSGEDFVLEGILLPEKYSMYTSDEFEKYSSKHKKMYEALFSANDIKILHDADSMYVWANILNLESSQLLAKSAAHEDDGSGKFSDLIKKDSEDEQGESDVQGMVRESKELKLISLRLYHKALDKKYPVFWLKLKDIAKGLGDGMGDDIKELMYQGDAYFREAKNTENVLGLSVEEYEKAGTLKRAGIESQENALNLYFEHPVGNDKTTKEEKPAGVVQKSYSELQSREEVKKEEKAPVQKPKQAEEKVQSVTNKEKISEAGEYRIQIGVFRNVPDQHALSKIPEVTSLELEGRGLTKYFSGRYKTKQEALDAIPHIIEAGFSGAYVVYFKDGKLSPMPE